MDQEFSLPLTGQDMSENETDFILIKPVPAEIRVSSLKSSMFYFPDGKIFMDKTLPDPEPSFYQYVPNDRFSPDYFTGLHNLVNAPGPHYPEGTYNYFGAKISLVHTNFNLPSWRSLLADYPRKELVCDNYVINWHNLTNFSVPKKLIDYIKA